MKKPSALSHRRLVNIEQSKYLRFPYSKVLDKQQHHLIYIAFMGMFPNETHSHYSLLCEITVCSVNT